MILYTTQYLFVIYFFIIMISVIVQGVASRYYELTALLEVACNQ